MCVCVYFEVEHAHIIDKKYHIIGVIKIKIQYYSIVSLLEINTVALRNQMFTTFLEIVSTTLWSYYKSEGGSRKRVGEGEGCSELQ